MSIFCSSCSETGSLFLPTRQISTGSFIIWNINKALKINPCMDLKHAMQSVHERLERGSREKSELISHAIDQRYLTCALLAWKRLCHKDVDSLYQFIEENRFKLECNDSQKSSRLGKIDSFSHTNVISKSYEYDACYKDANIFANETLNFHTTPRMGPVEKLPFKTNIVMRVEDIDTCSSHNAKKKVKLDNKKDDIINKIDAACCKDVECVERLSDLDKAIDDLRSRAAKLARREAERGELLERAEAAWKDLELGYQRRLSLCIEKENDFMNQIKNTIDERDRYKNSCTGLVDVLKEHGQVTEKERSRLKGIEKEACSRACLRLRLSQESAQSDTLLTEHLCIATQIERDLMFKEEQAQRKVWSIQNDIDSTQCLTYEVERAMRFELAGLKDQIKHVSEELYIEQNENEKYKLELQELLQEKADIIEDLNACKVICDGRMQARVDELKQKRKQLVELEDKLIDCKCKMPQDAAVEVKRTPSLAALCFCTLEDKLSESCSCTSLRSQVLSNLLADLFRGLQSELSVSSTIMPCQLLKCFENKHDWERSSTTKANLLNFFAQLLVRELDIAIATAIEKYHAKWVGKCCADQVREIPCCDIMDEGRQDSATERRAQKLASKLAEQLCNRRVEQINKSAKEIISKGPPPCQCKNQAAAFPCIVKTPLNTMRNKNDGTVPLNFKRTMKDVNQLRMQMEDLKSTLNKECVKKDELCNIEKKVTKMVQNMKKTDTIKSSCTSNKLTKHNMEKKNYSQCDEYYDAVKLTKNKNFEMDTICLSVQSKHKPYVNKIHKKKDQCFAVNLCLCKLKKDFNKFVQFHKERNVKPLRAKKNKKMLNENQPKPITVLMLNDLINSPKNRCPSMNACFHKMPSNTSIDTLLYNLKKRKNNNFAVEEISNIESNKYGKLPTFSAIEYGSNSKLLDKGTNYGNAVPPITESVYIGEINLDKSIESTCKCKVREYLSKNKQKLSSDELLTSLSCDFCKCIKIQEENKDKAQNIESNLSSPHIKQPSYKGRNSIMVLPDSLICNDEKKSEAVFSDAFNVNLIGVTLKNINKIYKNKITCTLSRTQDLQKKTVVLNKMLQSHDYDYEVKNIFSSDVKDSTDIKEDSQSKCICCDLNDAGASNDLEINAFNLLEEHLEGKLYEFQCKYESNSKPNLKESDFFSSILQKIKRVISESTNPLYYSCAMLNNNETRWSRAYGLLEEYLKLKMKRIQCSCVATDQNKTSVLPEILKRICDLIESDFERLADKFKYKIVTNSFQKKQLDHKTSPIRENFAETFVQVEDCKSSDNACSQVSSCITKNKSCNAVQLDLQRLNTLEKYVSCELRDIYLTDCKCQKVQSVPQCGGDSNTSLAACTRCTQNKHEIVTFMSETIKNREPIPPTRELSLLFSQSVTEPNENLTVNKLPYPYFGYTLNCSCDRSLGKCHCIKSMNYSYEKINSLWNSGATKGWSGNSYIMSKTLNRIKSKSLNISSSLYSGNKLNTESCAFNEEKVVLNKSEEDFEIYHNVSKSVNSNIYEVTDENGVNLYDFKIDNKYTKAEIKETSDKHFLYDSLHLPTGHIFNDIIPHSNQDSDHYKNNLDRVPEKCDCKEIPVCHVKKLIENMETTFTKSKCDK